MPMPALGRKRSFTKVCLLPKRMIAFSFESNPITANHIGGTIGGFSKKLEQLFLCLVLPKK